MSDFKAKLHQIPCGSLQHSPDPLYGFKGPTSKRVEGKGRRIGGIKRREGAGKRGGPTSKGRGGDVKGGERGKGMGERREGKGGRGKARVVQLP